MIARKGQTRIIGEMLLFSTGVIIVGYVLIIFSSAQANITQLSTQDQVASVAKLVKTAIMSAAESGSSNVEVRFEIPTSVSGKDYVIELNEDGDNLLRLYLYENPDTSITEELFNIGQKYTIQESVLTGSAKYLVLEIADNNIMLKRDFVEV
ncbi:MAG: hypothetical protein ABIG30_00520 [Candidatus Aenigmatarchaeota archaeon]